MNTLSTKVGRTKTSVVEEAIKQLNANDKQNHQQIELLSKQNDQLQMMLSATKALINEKDQKYNDMMQSKGDLIAELRRRHRGFFSRLFGKKQY